MNNPLKNPYVDEIIKQKKQDERVREVLRQIGILEKHGKDAVEILLEWADRNDITTSEYDNLTEIVLALGKNLTKKYMKAIKETPDDQLVKFKQEVIKDLETKEWTW